MSKPEFRFGSHLLPGLVAVALFGVLAWVFLGAEFQDPAGFGDVSVVEGIGYALLNIAPPSGVPVEGFLAAFILIALVLDAALDGAIMLARRDEEGGAARTASLETDGGEPNEVRRSSSDRRSDGGERSFGSRTSEDGRNESSGSETSAASRSSSEKGSNGGNVDADRRGGDDV